ncbi:MAG TPA: ROK family protein [Actinoplanes sp.]|nr:ROK family protein [Actinoplanes sp.]
MRARPDLIIAAVREAGRTSRADLTRLTGMARMTVNRIVTELLGDGLLTEEEAVADGARAGRPARSLTLGPAAGGVVGALVTTDGVRVAAADLTGAIRTERFDPDTSLDTLAALIADCEAETGGRTWATVAGFATPPDGDPRHRLGRRIIVRTVAELSLLGEVGYGVAAGQQDVCYLRIGTGIECGLLLGGVLHHGASGAAGQIGHVQMDEIGPFCRCGHRGCLETIASTPAILAAVGTPYGGAAGSGQPPITAARAVALARHDAAAERVLADAGHMIGRVVADLANTVNPALVVLDGPLVEEDGPIVTAVRETVHRYAQPEVAATTGIRVGTLGARAGLLGALFAGLRATPGGRGSRTQARSLISSTSALAPPEAAPSAASTSPAPPVPPASSASPVSPAEKERAARREIIVEALRGRGPAARSDLVKVTRLPRPAVAELLAGLVRDGVAERCAPVEVRPGRPSPYFRLVTPSVLLVGIEIGAFGVRVAAADGAGQIRYSGFLPAELSSDSRPLLRSAAEFARDVLREHGDRIGPDTRFAASVPAPVHPVSGQFGERSVLTMFSGFSPGDDMAAVLGRPVRVINNGQLAALAETRRGAAQGARDVLYLSADQYAGAGLVTGGRMYPGAIGYAGEVGHLTVREVGPFCACGRRGCLTPFLSPAYFAALYDRGAGDGPPTEERLLTLATSGDRPVQRALLDAGRLIGRTVTPLVTVFNPAVVVVGGRFTEPGPFVVDGIREALLRHCSPAAAAALTVVPAALGRDAEVLGAIEALLRPLV